MKKISKFNKENKIKKILTILSIFLIVISVFYYSFKTTNKSEKFKEITVGQFYQYAADKKVKTLKITPGILFSEYQVVMKDNEKFDVIGPGVREIRPTIDSSIDIEYIKPIEPIIGAKELPGYISVMLIGLMAFLMISSTSGAGKMDGYTDSDLKFSDVAGNEEAKTALQEVVEYLREPSKYEEIGAQFPKGLIMDGPPGTGKTLLAKSVAGEAGANFIAVNGSDFSSMFLSVSGMKVKRLFTKARKNAPCIIFIDEIDAMGGKRLNESSAVAREMGSTLNSLLVQMDGFEPNTGVIVIAATNRIELLDSALLRSGRFDRHVHLQLPNLHEREQILEIHSKKMKTEQLDLHTVAKSCIGMSGADLSNLINQAALIAVSEGAQSISTKHALQGRDRLIMGDARLSYSKSMTVETKKLLSIHEAGHALIGIMCGPDPISRISIVARGASLGQTFFAPSKERVLYKEDEIIGQIKVLLGGRAAEIVIGETATTGASDDLLRASTLALDYYEKYAMNTASLLIVGQDSSAQNKYINEQKADALLIKCMQEIKELIIKEREFFDLLVNSLMENEEINEIEIESLRLKTKLLTNTV